uniref:Orf108 n=1 Tax=Ancoracysta twista TaxID=2044563 RepID=A0A2H4R8E1_9EUKA|nr:orf108 [Ancoracysta twista]ATY40913.1 orf108 [Ancoracysta twista]
MNKSYTFLKLIGGLIFTFVFSFYFFICDLIITYSHDHRFNTLQLSEIAPKSELTYGVAVFFSLNTAKIEQINWTDIIITGAHLYSSGDWGSLQEYSYIINPAITDFLF